MRPLLDQNLVRGLFLAAIALFFGLGALRLDVGTLTRTGPGPFPLVVSSLLLLLALATIIRSRFAAARPISAGFLGVIALLILGQLFYTLRDRAAAD
jgi:hypothetical protein